MCSVVANSLNFVEGAQIHHPLGRCCAFSERCRMSGGHPFARTEAERRPCRGQSEVEQSAYISRTSLYSDYYGMEELSRQVLRKLDGMTDKEFAENSLEAVEE